MPFATSPFVLEPVRTNELKESQIYKEINSLEQNIARLEKSIEDLKPTAKEQEQEPQVVEFEKLTSKYYRTKNLPMRFERPGSFSLTRFVEVYD